MNYDSSFSLIFGIASVILNTIMILQNAHKKLERWQKLRIFNLIFGFALIGTNLLMMWYSVPPEIQIYSAAGVMWAPYTTPSSIPNLPHQFVYLFSNFISTFTTFILFAIGGLCLGFTMLRRGGNIGPPPPEPTPSIAPLPSCYA